MCGLAGAIEAGLRDDAWGERLSRMADRIAHRGPDDRGIWSDADRGVGLAHTRLAILGLGPEGHQPMESPAGRYVAAYNGEIYNHDELRRDPALAAVRWRGTSDTEVMLAGFDVWGVEATVSRLNGMFAFAVWDRQERRLWLGRDRLGIKPLYVGRGAGGALLFASELHALRSYPGFDPAIDRGALREYMRFGFVPAPRSIHRNARKVAPGVLLRVPVVDGRAGEPEERPYWSLSDIARRGIESRFAGDAAEAADELERRLRISVRRRMIADVPLGAFLSGGVDSSAVVALMQQSAGAPVKTFSIGFDEPGYDESGPARQVAAHLGTDHLERRVTPEDARAILPELPAMFDEPFADPSQIPMALVSRLARERVTVALSGDGGDELFAGYKRYAAGRDLLRGVGRLPRPLRVAVAGVIRGTPTSWLDGTLAGLRGKLGSYGRDGRPGDKIKKLAEILPAATDAGIYRGVLSLWRDPDSLVHDSGDVDEAPWAGLADPVHNMMLADGTGYLPDDILTKVDRASMNVALEARVPLLDHEVVEFAWTLPLAWSFDDPGGKGLLREVLSRHVPRQLTDRPKMGFGVPVGSWIRGPLRGWATDLLAPGRLERGADLDPQRVQQTLTQHLSGEHDWGPRLWAVLMYEAWKEAQQAHQ